MKKLLLISLLNLSFVTIFPQCLGVGFGYNTEKQYQVDLKCFSSNNSIIMLEVNFIGKTNPYSFKHYDSSMKNDNFENHKMLKSTTINIGFGGDYYKQWYIIGMIGFNTRDYFDVNKDKNVYINNTYEKRFNIGCEFGYFITPNFIISTNVNLIGNAGLKIGINI